MEILAIMLFLIAFISIFKLIERTNILSNRLNDLKDEVEKIDKRKK